MDMHLSFIVDQTQKYSSWLTQGLTTTPTGTATPSDPSLISTASPDGKYCYIALKYYTIHVHVHVFPKQSSYMYIRVSYRSFC